MGKEGSFFCGLLDGVRFREGGETAGGPGRVGVGGMEWESGTGFVRGGEIELVGIKRFDN